jgi:hypothetical protein
VLIKHRDNFYLLHHPDRDSNLVPSATLLSFYYTPDRTGGSSSETGLMLHQVVTYSCQDNKCTVHPIYSVTGSVIERGDRIYVHSAWLPAGIFLVVWRFDPDSIPGTLIDW